MYIDAELAHPKPRRLKYTPRENPTSLDPIWLCLASIIVLTSFGVVDFLNSSIEQRDLMIYVFPFLVLPFFLRLRVLMKQRRLLKMGEPVPALLNMVPRKLWWPKDFLGFSGVVYDVQAKYEYAGRKYILDCLSKDPTKWRGKYVSVLVDPKRPSNAVIYQICSYQVE